MIFGGGISRIGQITEKMVPIMAGFYLLGGLIIVIMNIEMFRICSLPLSKAPSIPEQSAAALSAWQ